MAVEVILSADAVGAAAELPAGGGAKGVVADVVEGDDAIDGDLADFAIAVAVTDHFAAGVGNLVELTGAVVAVGDG